MIVQIILASMEYALIPAQFLTFVLVTAVGKVQIMKEKNLIVKQRIASMENDLIKKQILTVVLVTVVGKVQIVIVM